MAGFSLQLLGGVSARLESGASIAFPTKKTKALMSYLAVPPGKSHSRGKLSALLWEDSGEEQARANLRQTLTYLRKALSGLEHEAVATDGDAVALDPAALEIDVVDFERLAQEATPAALERAGELYQGEFLEGFDLRGEAFEAWQRAERQRLHEVAVEVLSSLLTHYVAVGRSDDAVQAAIRLLAIDPLREDAHRALIRLRLHQGQRALALQQYQDCCDLLRRELGTDPDPETERLHRRIREGLSEEAPRDATPARESSTQAPGAAEPLPLGTAAPGRIGFRKTRLPLISAAAAALLIFGATVFWMSGTSSESEKETMISTGLYPPLPEGPSIAVLAFRNLSADPDQEYFADGLSEDLITDLSKLRALFVIARESSFAYKDKAVDVRQIGRELGVGHILEGSVRKVDGQVRITAQLVDASSGNHLWAQRYDRPLTDVFAVQDEIRNEIVASLDVALVEGEQARHWRKGTTNLEAYELFLRSHEVKLRFTEATTHRAIELLQQVIELDPAFAKAWVHLGWSYDMLIWSGWAQSPSKTIELAFAAANRAVVLDENSGDAHTLLGSLIINYEGDHEKGIAELEKGMALSPNGADSHAIAAFFLPYVDRGKEAVAAIEKAMRLNPNPPAWYYSALGAAYLGAGRHHDSIAASRECVTRLPDHMMCNLRLILAYTVTGRENEARTRTQEVLRIDPEFSVSKHFSEYAELATRDPAVRERRMTFLRDAGLPE